MIYFAHPISDYDQIDEAVALRTISLMWPDYEVINPNDPVLEYLYKRDGFNVFLKEIRKCNLVVGIPFPDGSWGAGVYKEMHFAQSLGQQVWKIDRETGALTQIDINDISPLTIEETRAKLKVLKQK